MPGQASRALCPDSAPLCDRQPPGLGRLYSFLVSLVRIVLHITGEEFAMSPLPHAFFDRLVALSRRRSLDAALGLLNALGYRYAEELPLPTRNWPDGVQAAPACAPSRTRCTRTCTG